MSRFQSMSLTWKLPILNAVPLIILVLCFGMVSYFQINRVFEKNREIGYTAYMQDKKLAIEGWLQDSYNDTSALSQSYGVRKALQDFKIAWQGALSDPSALVREAYIEKNAFPVGQKDALDKAEDRSRYSHVHGQHHPGLRSYQKSRGFYDLFLFDVRGNLIYSVFKEDDFGLNFMTGQYAQSGLGEAFNAAKSLGLGEVHITDIAPYAPSAGAPAMFMASPIIYEEQTIGVVAVQLPLDRIEQSLRSSDTLGETGQAYLVDAKGRSLSPSRFDDTFAVLDILPTLPHISSALAGQVQYFPKTEGLSGQSVVAKSDAINVPQIADWGLVFEIDYDEANAFGNQFFWSTIIELLMMTGLLILISYLSVRSVVRHINMLSRDMDAISQQDYARHIKGQERGDELGFISRTLESLQERLKIGAQAQEREQEIAQENLRVVELVTGAMEKLAKGDFTHAIEEHFPGAHKSLRYAINDAMSGLNEAIENVRHTTDGLHRGASEISGAASDLSKRTEGQAITLEQSAAALEQITSSVTLASQHVQTVEQTVQTARKNALASGEVVEEAMNAMNDIAASSESVSQIISVIDDIAFQTNLLALNAGVEAARAGEAGRGFAVVASEVRALAQRSSESASEIKGLIGKSTASVGQGVELVGRTGSALKEIVEQVKDISSLIQDIAQSSREQSLALGEINNGMSQLDQMTQGNAAMAEENTAAAQLLKQDADQLSEIVGQFKTNTQKMAPRAIAAE